MAAAAAPTAALPAVFAPSVTSAAPPPNAPANGSALSAWSAAATNPVKTIGKSSPRTSPALAPREVRARTPWGRPPLSTPPDRPLTPPDRAQKQLLVDQINKEFVSHGGAPSMTVHQLSGEPARRGASPATSPTTSPGGEGGEGAMDTASETFSDPESPDAPPADMQTSSTNPSAGTQAGEGGEARLLMLLLDASAEIEPKADGEQPITPVESIVPLDSTLFRAPTPSIRNHTEEMLAGRAGGRSSAAARVPSWASPPIATRGGAARSALCHKRLPRLNSSATVCRSIHAKADDSRIIQGECRPSLETREPLRRQAGVARGLDRAGLRAAPRCAGHRNLTGPGIVTPGIVITSGITCGVAARILALEKVSAPSPAETSPDAAENRCEPRNPGRPTLYCRIR